MKLTGPERNIEDKMWGKSKYGKQIAVATQVSGSAKRWVMLLFGWGTYLNEKDPKFCFADFEFEVPCNTPTNRGLDPQVLILVEMSRSGT